MVPVGQLLPVLGIAMQAAAAVFVLFWFVLPRFKGRFVKNGSIPGPAFWLPLIGETPQLFQSPSKYMWNRWLSYGGVFRTNLLGQEVYVVGEQEALRPVWSDETSFEFFIPGKSFSYLITDIRHMKEPHQHAFFRRRVGQAVGPLALSSALLPPLAEVVGRHLDAWGQRGRVELMEACEELSMDIALEVVTGHPLPPAPEDKALVRRLFRTVLNGLYGLPILLPGTALYKAVRARKRLMAMLWPLVEAEAAEVVARLRTGKGQLPRWSGAALHSKSKRSCSDPMTSLDQILPSWPSGFGINCEEDLNVVKCPQKVTDCSPRYNSSKEELAAQLYSDVPHACYTSSSTSTKDLADSLRLMPDIRNLGQAVRKRVKRTDMEPEPSNWVVLLEGPFAIRIAKMFGDDGDDSDDDVDRFLATVSWAATIYQQTKSVVIDSGARQPYDQLEMSYTWGAPVMGGGLLLKFLDQRMVTEFKTLVTKQAKDWALEVQMTVTTQDILAEACEKVIDQMISKSTGGGADYLARVCKAHALLSSIEFKTRFD